MRVLIVDPDPHGEAQLTEVLRSLGHDTVSLGEGPNALEAVLADGFDMAILDPTQNEADGIAPFLRLRGLKPELKAAVTASDPTDPLVLAAMDRGALAVLAKPVSKDAVVEALGKAAVSSSKPRLMVVDNNEDVAMVIRLILEDRGFEVETASTPVQAEALAKSFDPHIVVLDIRLGDSSGLDLLPTLRKLCPGMTCVLMSGDMDDDTRGAAERLGVMHFLQKPLDFDRLVESLLHLREAA